MTISRLNSEQEDGMRKTFLGLLFAFATAGISSAGTITTAGQIPGTTLNAIDLTGFATTGAEMTGMTVAALFGGGMVTCIWAPTGVDTGGCSGSAVGVGSFSVSQAGDTFSNNWILTNTTAVGAAPIPLLGVFFDGVPGLTVFDRTFGGVSGTAGSELGADATGTTPAGQPNGVALYIDQVATLGNPPVGDLFARLSLTFGNGLLPQNSAMWIADTDTIGLRGNVPEPGNWAMLLLGGCVLICFGRLRLR
jgi:hypothetical protein